MNGSTLPPAIVLGLSPTGLYAIRELGRAGVPVTGVSTVRQAGAMSRYVKDVIIEADPAKRLNKLIGQFRNAPSKPVLIPTSDQDIDFIIMNAEALKAHFRFQASYADGLASAIVTKESFYALCEKHDIAYPALWRGDREEIASRRADITFPCMIKPSRIHDIKDQMNGQKGWVARNLTEFDRAISEIPDQAGILLAQEIVPGPESEITLFCGFFDDAGECQQSFTCRKLRQYPPGFGSASLVESRPEPDSLAKAEGFLRALAYRGIAAAEFKRGPDGELKIIEINPRPSLWFSASTASARYVTLAAYRALAGLSAPTDTPQKQGVLWRYVLKDLYSSVFYRLKRSFLLPAPKTPSFLNLHRTTWAVFATDDPAPAFAEIANFGGKGVRAFLSRLRRG